MSQVTNQQFKERGFPMPTFISRAFDTLIALLLASILGTILLGVSSIFAMNGSAFASEGSDSAFYFDESGKMQQHGYWSPSNRSRDLEVDRRAYNEFQNRETLRQQDETIRSYHAPNAYNSTPSFTNPNPMFQVFPGPGMPPKLCQRSFDAIYCH